MAQLLTVRELADALNISNRATYRLIERGVPYYRAGRLIRFRLDEVLAALRREELKAIEATAEGRR